MPCHGQAAEQTFLSVGGGLRPEHEPSTETGDFWKFKLRHNFQWDLISVAHAAKKLMMMQHLLEPTKS